MTKRFPGRGLESREPPQSLLQRAAGGLLSRAVEFGISDQTRGSVVVKLMNYDLSSESCNF